MLLYLLFDRPKSGFVRAKQYLPVIRTGNLLSVILSSALQYASIALFADDAALSHSSSCLEDFGQKLDILCGSRKYPYNPYGRNRIFQ